MLFRGSSAALLAFRCGIAHTMSM